MSRSSLFAIALTALLSFIGADVSAQTLESALSSHFATDGGAALILRDGSATYEHVLTLERVASGAYVAEVALASPAGTLRYPIKVERGASGDWSVVWEPTAEYAAALLGIASSGRLPSARAENAWRDEARLPALPLIGTRERVITPFGTLDAGESAEGKSQGDLDVSPTLVQHAHLWIRTVLEEDPGPAGFDVLLDRKANWTFANKLFFNMSMVGLFQITFVTTGHRGLGVVEASSPVTASTGAPPATVVALYPLTDGYGIRASRDGAPLQRKGCRDEMNLCVADAAELPDALEGLIPPGGNRAMFAASSDTLIGDAVSFLAAFSDYMGLGHHRVIVGYIQR